MKLAVSATGDTLDSEIDPRFGRCQYFIIVDTETMAFEAVGNSSSMSAGGAGIAAGQMIAEKDVEVVLTGNCGPNAYQTLSAAGVKVITGVSGSVKSAVEAYKSGKLEPVSQPNVEDHFGKNSNPGMGGGMSMVDGRGMGGGRGMGMGGGRGMGMGRGRGMGMGPGMMPMDDQPYQPVNKEQELEFLKRESQFMAQRIDEIQRRINEIENMK
jgi:predicted Fe-Mo cluster-binding NifX family protein